MTVPDGLAETHLRRLLADFRYMDELWVEANARLVKADVERLFPRFMPDASEAQVRLVAEHAARFRAVMRNFLEDHRAFPAAPPQSAIGSMGVMLSVLEVALGEITPKQLAGYGALTPEGGQAIVRLHTSLQEIVDSLRAHLRAMG